MPTLINAVPKYRKHRASGQAIVTLVGKDYYLGPHGTKARRLEYDRVIGEWLAAGRLRHQAADPSDITVSEVCAAFWKYAKKYFVKHGTDRRGRYVSSRLEAARAARATCGGVRGSARRYPRCA